MKRISLNVTKIIYMLFCILIYLIYIYVCSNFNNLSLLKSSEGIVIISWIGIIMYIISVFTWYKLTGHLFDLYTIFLTFAYIFNYGHCFLWAFNIHAQGEIGSGLLYNSIVPSNLDITKTQIITLLSLALLHFGVLFFHKKNDESKINIKKILFDNSILYKASIIIFIISFPFKLYQLINYIIIRLNYGYGAIYYGAHIFNNPLVNFVSRFFIPSLFGILICSNFSKKGKTIFYFSFGIFVLLSLIIGDRGEWLYPLFIYVYLHHTYIKKINIRSFFLIVILGYLFLKIVMAFTFIRNVDISMNSIQKSLEFENDPAITSIIHMGSSMGIQLVVIKNNYPKYPNGNSYLYGIASIIGENNLKMINQDYEYITDWFSQQYLGLKNTGAGLSIVGESLMNYGQYFGPVFLILIGAVISKILNYINIKKNSKNMFYCVIVFLYLIEMSRGAFGGNFKIIIQTFILFYFVSFIIVQRSKKGMMNYEK